MLYRPALLLGAFCAALSVVLGAFGAHALKSALSPELLQTFETGVRYQFYHAVVLLFVGLFHAHVPTRLVRICSTLFAIGIGLFSGSIYLIVALKTEGVGVGAVGALTPVGGLFFIAGWICLAWACTNLPKFKV